MEAYVQEASTRMLDELVKALGAETGISKSEVSRICSELDAELEAFRNRPLDGPFPYVFADAAYVKGPCTGPGGPKGGDHSYRHPTRRRQGGPWSQSWRLRERSVLGRVLPVSKRARPRLSQARGQ
jgi:hypothetical protein